MRASRLSLIIAASLVAIFLTGCRPPLPNYVDRGEEYNRTTALTLMEKVEDPGLSDEPVDDAKDLRHDALVSLRSRGGGAASAARLITKVFPAEIASVPFYVETASYEGTSAVVVLEAMGRRGGRLSDKRVWVISESGDVLITGTR